MIRTVIVAAVLLAIACGGYFAWDTSFSPKAKLSAQVRKALTDPDSARFDALRINAQSGVACGSVNAKNKLGGYVGFVRFIASSDGTVLFEPQDPTGNESPSDLIGLIGKALDFLVAHKKHCSESPA